MPRTKSCPARVKGAVTDGEFTALVSVFGNVDSYGDVVVRGAFEKSLARWAESGDSLPVIWSHDHRDPFSHIGHVTDARETSSGLQVTGLLDLDNPKAAQVHRLLKGRRVTQFSFAFDVVQSRPAERDGRSVTELLELDLFEVGPCLVGVNQETELLAVKAAPTDRTSAAKALREITEGMGARAVLTDAERAEVIRCMRLIKAEQPPPEPAITPAALAAWAAAATLTMETS